MKARRRWVHSQMVPSASDGISLPWQSGQSGQVIPAPLMRVQLPSITVPRATATAASAKRRNIFMSGFQRSPQTGPGRTMTLAGRGGARAKASAVKRWWVLAACLLLVGCREVRVKTFAQGTTSLPGGNQVSVIRNAADLGKYGIKAPVHFKGEFGMILLMGPHERTGYKQIVESIRANDNRVRVVAFERAPPTAANRRPVTVRTHSGSSRTRSTGAGSTSSGYA